MAHRRNDDDEDAYSEGSRKSKVSVDDFNEPQPNRREKSDDGDYDIERDIDEAPDRDDNDIDKLKNKLLFYVQGLGSTKDFNQLDIYVKGPHCEDSLKDIYKLCEGNNMLAADIKAELGKWEVLQRDLIPLLVTQHQDKKLTFYLLALLEELTTIPEDAAQSNNLIGYLQVY